MFKKFLALALVAVCSAGFVSCESGNKSNDNTKATKEVADNTEKNVENKETTKETANVDNILFGDANCDGKITPSDYTAVVQYLGNPDKYSLSAQGELNADVDGSIGVTASDAVLIQKYNAGVITEFTTKAE